MNRHHEELAQVFIRQYNLSTGTKYEFECLRNSMFNLPVNRSPSYEIYEMAFIEGKKRRTIVADFMVLARLQKRLIIEVAEAHIPQEVVNLSPKVNIIESYGLRGLVSSMETLALDEVVCSKFLLVDFRKYGSISLSNPDGYKNYRLDRDRQWAGRHWFKEIWLAYDDETSGLRCIQIW